MPRVDAQRNLDALLAAADTEFALHGVDVNVRAIAIRAGVGTATLYRHFPTRLDLIGAVFRHEVDACAAQAPRLAAEHPPWRALELWVEHYATFIASKRGLAAALRGSDPHLNALPQYFQDRLGPAIGELLTTASAAGIIHRTVDPIDMLAAVAKLCAPTIASEHEDDHDQRSRRMIAILMDGLRYQP